MGNQIGLIILQLISYIVLLMAIYCASRKHPEFIKRACGKLIMFSAISCVVLLVVDIEWTTHRRADSILSDLAQEFKTVARNSPYHVYAKEIRGSTLDYHGKLDKIIERRDALIQQSGLTPIGVEWVTDGSIVSISGLYMRLPIFLGFLAIYVLDIFLLRRGYIFQKPRFGFWSPPSSRHVKPRSSPSRKPLKRFYTGDDGM